VRQHSTEVMCTHWPPSPTALHLRMQWRGLLSRVGTSSGGARGDAHQTQGTGNDNTKRGRGGSKKEKQEAWKLLSQARNHEKPRRAVFEHRHHRKAPAALAGP
jgi:hypothetical protein